MPFFFDDAPILELEEDKISIGPATGFFENQSASYAENRVTERADSRLQLGLDVQAERRDAISKITGKSFQESIKPFLQAPDEPMEVGPYYQGQAINRFRDTLNPEQQSLVLTDNEIPERSKELALEKVAKNADVRARATGLAGGAGQFTGAAGALMGDPLVLATLPLGASAGSRILVAAAIESAIAGGVTAASQPVVQKWRKELGLPSGLGPALTNIGLATVAGFGLTAGIRGIGAGLGKLSDRQILQAAEELRITDNPDVSVAWRALMKELEIREQNPFLDTPAGMEAHARRTQAATANLEEHGRSAPNEFLDDVPDELFPGKRPPRPPETKLASDIEENVFLSPKDLDDLEDPLGASAARRNDEMTVNIKRSIDDGDDFNVVDFADETGVVRRVSDVMDDLDKDTEFVEQLGICL